MNVNLNLIEHLSQNLMSDNKIIEEKLGEEGKELL